MKIINLLIILALILFPAISPADDSEARKIMQAVEDRDDGDNGTSSLEMILIDKKGLQRIRKIRTFSKEKGADEQRLMFFVQPPDVKDTSFLTYDYDNPQKDDDQWLYLPALHKTKRIATSDKSGSFMGSDLNYADMTSLTLSDYDFYLKKEMTVRGKKTWMIESIPRSKEIIKETGYTRSLFFVQQDNHFVVRGIRWVKNGGYLKYMDVKKLEKIQGIWVATEMHVTKKKEKQVVHKTILKYSDVTFGNPLKDDFFTIRRMEKGL
jgi:hypothetical protein